MPKLNIAGHLDYWKCQQLFESRRSGKSTKQVHSKGNYHITDESYYARPDGGSLANGYTMLMYRTHILVYYADGAIMLNDWNSVTTTQVLNDYGPVYVGNNSASKFVNKRRWRSHHSGWKDSYPMPGNGMFIYPDGFVRGLKDKRRRINPELRAERAQIMKQFRERNIGPFMLGGYPMATMRRRGAFEAHVPNMNLFHRNEVFDALLVGDIDRATEAWHAVGSHALTTAFGRNECQFDTMEMAALASMKAILRTAMRRDEWYDEEVIEYPPIKAV